VLLLYKSVVANVCTFSVEMFSARYFMTLNLVLPTLLPPWNVAQMCSDVLLTVHLSIFISVFNQIGAQNLFHNKFYFMPVHVSSTCAYQ